MASGRTARLSAGRFEAALREAAALPETVQAGAAPQTSALLREAIGRLERRPDLRRLAPDGMVLYSDPILARAFAYARIANEAIAAAAWEPGSELREGGRDDLRSLARWIQVAVRTWWSRDRKQLRDLAAFTPKKTLRLDQDVLRLAVVGDAGYRGNPQDHVLFLIRERHVRAPFDFVVHLGDTYFAGSELEFQRHLLMPFGELGIEMVTLCGNHDLYHGGAGYMFALTELGQPGRYFLIETPGWRIACLDTALAAESYLPSSDGKLDRAQLRWLHGLLAADDPRPLVLMSHHYIVSGWEDTAPSLSRQLGRIAPGRVFAWYWGHEHGCACYARGSWGFYGACIGNGAFLQPRTPPSAGRSTPEWFAQSSCACRVSRAGNYWPHGFLELELGPHGITETYRLEGDETHIRRLTVG